MDGFRPEGGHIILAIPFRSSLAVLTMFTVEPGSSTQSTATSWIRKPLRSATTRSSVSKNQPLSSTIGTSSRATSARSALKPQCSPQDDVVTAGNELALGPPYHSCAWREPRADRHVAVTCQQWGHQWQKGVEVGGEVDIHICDHRSAAAEPCLPQCAAPSFLLEVQGSHAI
jgi:hypothetical protein